MIRLRPRPLLRGLLASAYAVAGYLHITLPEPFLRITPRWVPEPELVVRLTGIAELAGALALAQPWSRPLRRAGSMGLAAYALCVWPANLQHFLIDRASADGGLGLAYHVPRLLFQPVLMWLPLWAAEVIAWPFGRQRGD